MIKVIKPYLKKSRDEHKNSLASNLYGMGKAKVPGARTFVTPKSDGFGRFLTGLDENARHLQLLPADIREEISKQIKEKRVRLEAQLGVSLAPDSPYWKDVKPVVLKDEDNVFDLSDPEQELTFTWLSELKTIIAGSSEEILSGKVKEKTGIDPEFYIFSPTEALEKDFGTKKRINDAVKKLDLLAEQELRRIQYLLNLNVPNSAPFSEVYNVIDDYIRTPKTFGKSDPIEEFERVLAYTPEALNIKFLFKNLIEHRLLKQIGEAVVEGNNTIAKSVYDFEAMLTDPEVYYTWEKKLESKVNIINSI